jgi:hypothetical protein
MRVRWTPTKLACTAAAATSHRMREARRSKRRRGLLQRPGGLQHGDEESGAGCAGQMGVVPCVKERSLAAATEAWAAVSQSKTMWCCAVEGDGGATSGAACARDGRGFEGEGEWCPEISQTISRILPTAASFSACSATLPSTMPSQSSSAVSWNNLNVSEEQRNILRISSSLKSLSSPSLSRMASTNSSVASVSKRDEPAPTTTTVPSGCTCGGCFCDMIAGKGFEHGSDME